MSNKVFLVKYFLTYDVINEAIPYQKFMEGLIRACEAKKGDFIIDAGLWTGNVCIRLKESGSKPVRFDFSEKAIKIHMVKDQDAEANIGYLTNTLSFQNNSFDKVVS